MSKIAFIGVGTMGAPMASRLVAAGHHVSCYSRTRAARESTREFGGHPVGSVAEASNGAEIAITMLPDSPDVHAVATAPDGLLASLASSQSPTWIDMSTIDPAMARDLHESAAEKGVAALDAPVSGGEAGARDGELSVMVGGDAQVLESVRHVLDELASSVTLMGGPGSGQVAKAANQIIVAGALQILGEAIAFLRAHDADLSNALTAIGGGLAGSTVLQRKSASLLARDYSPSFRVELHAKDLAIVQRAAMERGLSLPATAVVSQLMAALQARGDGQLDHSALAKLVEELNGSEVSGG